MLQNRFITGPPLDVGLVRKLNLPQIEGRANFFQKAILDKSDLGGNLEFNGNYGNGSGKASLNVPYTVNAGQTVLVQVSFNNSINNLQSMIVTFLDPTGNNSYPFNLDPGGVGVQACP